MIENRRGRRAKRTRLERILQGMWQPGKYTLPTVALALAGCFPSTNSIGLSPDGRFLVLPMNSRGANVSISGKSHLVVYDLKTDTARAMDPFDASPFWIDVGTDVIAYSYFVDGKSASPQVAVVSGKTTKVFDSALFPTVSNDGRYVVFAQNPDSKDKLTGSLIRYEVKTGKTHDLGIQAGIADISPDGKRLVCLTRTDKKWTLELADIDGKNRKALTGIDWNFDKDSFIVPRWIDNQKFMYRTRSAATGPDHELFIRTLDGKVEQVTANDLEDLFPQMVGDDRVVYLSHAVGEQLPGEKPKSASVWMSQKKDGKWEPRSLGIKAYSFRIVGDDIIYLVPDGVVCKLYRAPLSNPKKTTDLGQAISQKVEDLPS